MEEWFARVAENLIDRVSGPMKFRLILQPLMSVIFAVRAGLQDSKEDQPPYFWAVFTNPAHRHALLRDGWKDVGKVFVIAIVMDVVYQLIVLRWVYPGEVLLVAAVLAFLPYLLIRGPVNRVARRR